MKTTQPNTQRPKLKTLLIKNSADKVPPGWMTKDELAKREGFTDPGSMRKIIADAIKAKLLETREFRVAWGQGIRPRPYFRYI